MADEKSKKRRFIEILSSSESDDNAAEEINSSTSCTDDDEDGDESEWNYSESDAVVDEDEDCEYALVDAAESTCNKAIQLIKGGRDFHDLNLHECKAYLRSHKLRLSGTKQECIERMKEHWKLKDRNGEVYYPRSSFTIDCTGDVCKGDVVLFHQKVYQISDKTKRRSFQRRTVAGRIIKESYGAAKQQHTFTVEVLWSRGTKKLDPLFPLLVKGRNLYKMKTFRKPWQNEKERLEVLSEKHKRGAAARNIRAMRKTDKSLSYKGAKHDKNFYPLNSSRTRERAHASKNCLYNHDVLAKSKKHLCSWNSKHGGSASHTRQPNLIQSPSLAFNHSHSYVFPVQLRNSHSTSGLPYPHHPPYLEWKEVNHGSNIGSAYSHSWNGNVARSFDHFPRSMNNHTSFYANPDSRRWR